MLGTIVNSISIIIGSLIGLFFHKSIKSNYSDIMLKSISLSIILIGMSNALKTENLMIVIFSMVLGSVMGEFLKIEENLNKIGEFLESKFASKGGNISKGFVTSSLVYCVGSMAIIGALESGLSGNHQTLFAKSTLDGISAIVFSSTMGIGVMLSSVSVFLYQGAITLLSSLLKDVLIASVVTEMSATGGLLILALGFNMLEFKNIKVGNMLPAIFMPLIFYMVQLLSGLNLGF
ncbi:MAG: DUF554 domain-containing protein [Acidaminobacteraceae bacterium]